MAASDFHDRLTLRAWDAGLELTAEQSEQLETYYRLLVRWNQRINLTSLSLNPLTDEAMDRLLLEPLGTARFVRSERPVWFDLGSGGGSPAIPLKLARPASQLIMVESRARKAAFLREAGPRATQLGPR